MTPAIDLEYYEVCRMIPDYNVGAAVKLIWHADSSREYLDAKWHLDDWLMYCEPFEMPPGTRSRLNVVAEHAALEDRANLGRDRADLYRAIAGSRFREASLLLDLIIRKVEGLGL